ncbi:MAG: polymer-forming cytoskeletal protein [Patescibacteria group bacterium]
MAKVAGAETIIAHGVRLDGDLVAEGDLVIEGEIHGTVKTNGDLRIGDQAMVEADIEAGNAVISGTVRGNINVRGKLELFPSSQMTGDVVTEVLAVGPGARVNGSVSMGGEATKGKKRTEADES